MINIAGVPPLDSLLIITDFNATLEISAKETDNCSQNAHAVIDIFVVNHLQYSVSVKCEDGMTKTKKVNDCDI
jgi:hypothetical protein